MNATTEAVDVSETVQSLAMSMIDRLLV